MDEHSNEENIMFVNWHERECFIFNTNLFMENFLRIWMLWKIPSMNSWHSIAAKNKYKNENRFSIRVTSLRFKWMKSKWYPGEFFSTTYEFRKLFCFCNECTTFFSESIYCKTNEN